MESQSDSEIKSYMENNQIVKANHIKYYVFIYLR